MKRNDETLETPITSMIDVVFQLIIFFVVAAAAQSDVIDKSIELAKSYYVPPLLEGPPPSAIVVNVKRINDDQVRFMLGGSEYSEDRILKVLKAARARTGDQTPIIIRSDYQVEYRHIQRVNDLVGRAGLYRVSHSAVQAAENP
jgi:biopolymer transport protein ExbD